MPYIITHTTDARWEAGEIPSRELIGRVGGLLREMARAGALLGGEGLRASSQGVRLQISRGTRTVTPGPFAGSNELTDGFVIVRVATLDEAVGWASRFGEVKRDVEIDIRPVTEPWDIGIGSKPQGLTTTRYMLLRKADRESEGGRRTPKQREALRVLLDEMDQAGVLITSQMLAPSAKGRRYKHSDRGRSPTDGPFAESKELIAGYVLFDANSLEDAAAWAPRYLEVVESPTVELREVEEHRP
jgi:hypothetical protein